MSSRGISSIARVKAYYIDKVVGLDMSSYPDANAVEGLDRLLRDVAVLDRVLLLDCVDEDVAGTILDVGSTYLSSSTNLDAGSTYLSGLDIGSESTSDADIETLEVLVLNTE